MVDRGVQSGSLRLSPEHLGPLEVRISVQSDQVSVWFGAAHADTRSALEQALPRLRDLFASQGLSLADAGVFREPPREQPRDQAYTSGVGESATRGVAEIDLPRATQKRGLLDAYA
jgi:flagellar hook-length control protein FliK